MGVKDWERVKLLPFAHKKGADCRKAAIVVSSIIDLLRLPECEESRHLIRHFQTLAEMYLREMDLWSDIVQKIQTEPKTDDGPSA